jgi:hypothetical protein
MIPKRRTASRAKRMQLWERNDNAVLADILFFHDRSL